MSITRKQALDIINSQKNSTESKGSAKVYKLPIIDKKNVKIMHSISEYSDPSYPYSESFSAELTLPGSTEPIKVQLKRFRPGDQVLALFNEEQDSLVRILSSGTKQFIPIYGVLQDERSIISLMYGRTLDTLITDMNNNEEKMRSDFMTHILYDISKGLYELHTLAVEQNASMLRPINSSNILIPPAFLDRLDEKFCSLRELDQGPPLVWIGDTDIYYPVNYSGGFNGEYSPECKTDGILGGKRRHPENYSASFDAWRFGRVAFQVWCHLTEFELDKFMKQALSKSRESKDILTIKGIKWLPQSKNGDIPDVVYDLIYRCWEIDPAKRISLKEIFETTKALMEKEIQNNFDDLFAKNPSELIKVINNNLKVYSEKGEFSFLLNAYTLVKKILDKNVKTPEQKDNSPNKLIALPESLAKDKFWQELTLYIENQINSGKLDNPLLEKLINQKINCIAELDEAKRNQHLQMLKETVQKATGAKFGLWETMDPDLRRLHATLQDTNSGKEEPKKSIRLRDKE